MKATLILQDEQLHSAVSSGRMGAQEEPLLQCSWACSVCREEERLPEECSGFLSLSRGEEVLVHLGEGCQQNLGGGKGGSGDF